MIARLRFFFVHCAWAIAIVYVEASPASKPGPKNASLLLCWMLLFAGRLTRIVVVVRTYAMSRRRGVLLDIIK